MPQTDDNKDVVDKVKSAIDEIKKGNEKIVKEQVDALNKLEDTMGILVNATNRLTSDLKDVTKSMTDTQKGMVMLNQRLQGGLTTVPFKTGAKGRGLALKLKPEEAEALSRTGTGRLTAGLLTAFKKLYLFFPSLGYAGVREMSRVARSVETMATMSANASGEEGGKRSLGRIVGGGLLRIFITLQAMFAIVKVIGFLFGDAIKPLQSVLKIFKMAITFILKPLFDMLFIVLLPLAIFFTVLFSSFYKWFARQGFKPLMRDMIVVIRAAVALAKGIASTVGGIAGGVKWLGGVIAKGYKLLFNVFDVSFKFVRSILVSIWNFWSGVFETGMKVLLAFAGWAKSFFDLWFRGIMIAIKYVLKGVDWVVNGVWNVLSWIWNVIKSLADAIMWAFDKMKNIFGFQSGGYVQRSGLYRLHAGEVVVPRNEANKNGTVNNYSINISVSASNGMDINDLVEEIERRLRSVISW